MYRNTYQISRYVSLVEKVYRYTPRTIILQYNNEMYATLLTPKNIFPPFTYRRI